MPTQGINPAFRFEQQPLYPPRVYNQNRGQQSDLGSVGNSLAALGQMLAGIKEDQNNAKRQELADAVANQAMNSGKIPGLDGTDHAGGQDELQDWMQVLGASGAGRPVAGRTGNSGVRQGAPMSEKAAWNIDHGLTPDGFPMDDNGRPVGRGRGASSAVKLPPYTMDSFPGMDKELPDGLDTNVLGSAQFRSGSMNPLTGDDTTAVSLPGEGMIKNPDFVPNTQSIGGLLGSAGTPNLPQNVPGNSVATMPTAQVGQLLSRLAALNADNPMVSTKADGFITKDRFNEKYTGVSPMPTNPDRPGLFTARGELNQDGATPPLDSADDPVSAAPKAETGTMSRRQGQSLPGGPNQGPNGNAPVDEPPMSQGVPSVRTKEDYAKLPSGATYRDPNGKIRTKKS